MNATERQSLLTIALMAAFADGGADTRERAQLERITAELGDTEVNSAQIYQDVILKRVTLEAATRGLSDHAAKRSAYEIAVAVCDADGVHGPAEVTFLEDLRMRLGISEDEAKAIVGEAATIASVPMAAVSAVEPAPAASKLSKAELDQMVLNYSILNGALELLPQNLASMAIIPLQMKMVYRIGKSYGYDLDTGHIKDFLATLGVGLASQYVEQFGRKLVSGLLGKLAGGVGRTIGNVGTGFAFSFATTYALGQIAQRYYGGGRTLSSAALKQGFDGVLAEAKNMQGRYLPQIQERARTLNLSEVMASIRK
jgi:uncharacterized protein (DUF697 family)/tellurite resistance protein